MNKILPKLKQKSHFYTSRNINEPVTFLVDVYFMTKNVIIWVFLHRKMKSSFSNNFIYNNVGNYFYAQQFK